MAIGIAELKLYTVIRDDAIDRIETAHPGLLQAHIDAAEEWAETALRNKYSPPIQEAKKRAGYARNICAIAIEIPGLKYGLPPNNPAIADKLEKAARRAEAWFEQLGRDEKKLPPDADQTPDKDETGPFARRAPKSNIDLLEALRTPRGCGCR